MNNKNILKGIKIILFLCFIFLACSPGIYHMLGREAKDPAVSTPIIQSFIEEEAIHISWEEDAKADQYILYRSRDTRPGELSIIYSGTGFEYLDRDCVPEGRYLYSLSKVRGLKEFELCEPVMGVCGQTIRDFAEPNGRKQEAVLLDSDLEANIFYYRSTTGIILQDDDWYYVNIPPRRVANIVITQVNREGENTHLYFSQEGELAFQIVDGNNIAIENYFYTEQSFYFKISPIAGEFLNDISLAGGAMVGYKISLTMITSI